MNDSESRISGEKNSDIQYPGTSSKLNKRTTGTKNLTDLLVSLSSKKLSNGEPRVLNKQLKKRIDDEIDALRVCRNNLSSFKIHSGENSFVGKNEQDRSGSSKEVLRTSRRKPNEWLEKFQPQTYEQPSCSKATTAKSIIQKPKYKYIFKPEENKSTQKVGSPTSSDTMVFRNKMQDILLKIKNPEVESREVCTVERSKMFKELYEEHPNEIVHMLEDFLSKDISVGAPSAESTVATSQLELTTTAESMRKRQLWYYMTESSGSEKCYSSKEIPLIPSMKLQTTLSVIDDIHPNEHLQSSEQEYACKDEKAQLLIHDSTAKNYQSPIHELAETDAQSITNSLGNRTFKSNKNEKESTENLQSEPKSLNPSYFNEKMDAPSDKTYVLDLKVKSSVNTEPEFGNGASGSSVMTKPPSDDGRQEQVSQNNEKIYLEFKLGPDNQYIYQQNIDMKLLDNCILDAFKKTKMHKYSTQTSHQKINIDPRNENTAFSFLKIPKTMSYIKLLGIDLGKDTPEENNQPLMHDLTDNNSQSPINDLPEDNHTLMHDLTENYSQSPLHDLPEEDDHSLMHDLTENNSQSPIQELQEDIHALMHDLTENNSQSPIHDLPEEDAHALMHDLTDNNSQSPIHKLQEEIHALMHDLTENNSFFGHRTCKSNKNSKELTEDLQSEPKSVQIIYFNEKMDEPSNETYVLDIKDKSSVNTEREFANGASGSSVITKPPSDDDRQAQVMQNNKKIYLEFVLGPDNQYIYQQNIDMKLLDNCILEAFKKTKMHKYLTEQKVNIPPRIKKKKPRILDIPKSISYLMSLGIDLDEDSGSDSETYIIPAYRQFYNEREKVTTPRERATGGCELYVNRISSLIPPEQFKNQKLSGFKYPEENPNNDEEFEKQLKCSIIQHLESRPISEDDLELNSALSRVSSSIIKKVVFAKSQKIKHSDERMLTRVESKESQQAAICESNKRFPTFLNCSTSDEPENTTMNCDRKTVKKVQNSISKIKHKDKSASKPTSHVSSHAKPLQFRDVETCNCYKPQTDTENFINSDTKDQHSDKEKNAGLAIVKHCVNSSTSSTNQFSSIAVNKISISVQTSKIEVSKKRTHKHSKYCIPKIRHVPKRDHNHVFCITLAQNPKLHILGPSVHTTWEKLKQFGVAFFMSNIQFELVRYRVGPKIHYTQEVLKFSGEVRYIVIMPELIDDDKDDGHDLKLTKSQLDFQNEINGHLLRVGRMGNIPYMTKFKVQVHNNSAVYGRTTACTQNLKNSKEIQTDEKECHDKEIQVPAIKILIDKIEKNLTMQKDARTQVYPYNLDDMPSTSGLNIYNYMESNTTVMNRNNTVEHESVFRRVYNYFFGKTNVIFFSQPNHPIVSKVPLSNEVVEFAEKNNLLDGRNTPTTQFVNCPYCRTNETKKIARSLFRKEYDLIFDIVAWLEKQSPYEIPQYKYCICFMENFLKILASEEGHPAILSKTTNFSQLKNIYLQHTLYTNQSP